MGRPPLEEALRAHVPGPDPVRVRRRIVDLSNARSGKRAAPLAAAWSAITGEGVDLLSYEPREAARAYRQVPFDLRLAFDVLLVDIARYDADPETRRRARVMLERTDELTDELIAQPVRKRRKRRAAAETPEAESPGSIPSHGSSPAPDRTDALLPARL